MLALPASLLIKAMHSEAMCKNTNPHFLPIAATLPWGLSHSSHISPVSHAIWEKQSCTLCKHFLHYTVSYCQIRCIFIHLSKGLYKYKLCLCFATQDNFPAPEQSSDCFFIHIQESHWIALPEVAIWFITATGESCSCRECVCVCAHAHACVCEKEREKERARERRQ